MRSSLLGLLVNRSSPWFGVVAIAGFIAELGASFESRLDSPYMFTVCITIGHGIIIVYM